MVLVHGTASSPLRWADMVNDLLEDKDIRDHYEFWFFTYNTGNPIPISANVLRRCARRMRSSPSAACRPTRHSVGWW